MILVLFQKKRKQDIFQISFVLVSDNKVQKVQKHNWYKDSYGYIVNNKVGRLHRYILGCQNQNQIVDHLDSKKWNNFDDNLEIVSASKNNQRRIKLKNKSSSFYGVSFVKSKNLWNVNYMQQYYGDYKDEIYAAQIYNFILDLKDPTSKKRNNVQQLTQEQKNQFINKKKKNNDPEMYCIEYTPSKKFSVCVDRKYLGIFNTLKEAQQERNHVLNLRPQKFNFVNNVQYNNQNIPVLPYKKYQSSGQVIEYFMIDLQDWDILQQYVFEENDKGYIVVQSKLKKTVHRIVMENVLGNDDRLSSKLYVIDHINRNKKNNQRSNLRIATQSQNGHNKYCPGSTEYKGVSLVKNLYRANIFKEKKAYMLGEYSEKIHAAIAYNLKSKQLYGNFAYQNDVQFNKNLTLVHDRLEETVDTTLLQKCNYNFITKKYKIYQNNQLLKVFQNKNTAIKYLHNIENIDINNSILSQNSIQNTNFDQFYTFNQVFDSIDIVNYDKIQLKKNQNGFKGITKTQNNRYQAQIQYMHQVYQLGTYDTKKIAKIAYQMKEDQLFQNKSVIQQHPNDVFLQNDRLESCVQHTINYNYAQKLYKVSYDDNSFGYYKQFKVALLAYNIFHKKNQLYDLDENKKLRSKNYYTGVKFDSNFYKVIVYDENHKIKSFGSYELPEHGAIARNLYIDHLNVYGSGTNMKKNNVNTDGYQLIDNKLYYHDQRCY